MTVQEALDAFGAGLAKSGLDAATLTTVGAQVGRGAKMMEAIALRAQAAAMQKKAATALDQAAAAEQAAQTG